MDVTMKIAIEISKLPIEDMSREEGVMVRSIIEQLWNQCNKIELDFHSVPFTSVSFLDEVIAKLYLGRDKADVMDKIKISNMVKEDGELLLSIVSSRIRQNRNKTTVAHVNTT